MKKTFATSMPNHIGAFLKASRCFSQLGINITRVSYDKSIDSHMLFLDVEGTKEQLKKAEIELEKIGYLQNNQSSSSIVLLEFCLRDVPGSVTDVLQLITEFNLNISYINSQENGSDYQYFKMGLYVDDGNKLTEFIARAEKLCSIRVIDYNSSERVYDNSIFYTAFTNGLSKMLTLSEKQNMTSVDTDPALCAKERDAVIRRLGVGDWHIFGSHGAAKSYIVKR